MKRVILAAVVLVVGIVSILGWQYGIKPLWESYKRNATGDDNTRITFRVRTDNYLGNYHATLSREFIKELAKEGIGLKYVEDDGLYKPRIAALKAREVDMIIIPESSYLKNGAEFGYPGVIVAPQSESRGADAIVVRVSDFPESSVNQLDDPHTSIAFVPDSASEDLLDVTMDSQAFVHLGRNDSWKAPAKDVDDALQQLADRKVSAAVAWEPAVSRFLNKHPGEYKVIWSSANVRNAIVDCFVVNWEFEREHGEDVNKFFSAFYRVLNGYEGDRPKLLNEIASTPGISLDREAIDATIRKVDWYNLGEACRDQMGIDKGKDGVLDGLLYWRALFVKLGKLNAGALDRPNTIINRSMLESLKNSPLASRTAGDTDIFKPMTEDEWKALPEAGTVNFEHIKFSTGSAELSDDAKAKIDKVVPFLTQQYADARLAVRGHTVIGGLQDEAQKLSQERAQAVIDYLVQQHKLDPDRFHPEGLGFSANEVKPPKQLQGEGFRQWQSRFSRVELVLLVYNTL